MKIIKIRIITIFLGIIGLVGVVYAADETFTLQDFALCPDPFEQPAEFRSKDQALGRILEDLSSGMNIKGVVLSGDRNYVIINENIISEGEDWNGLRVEKIFPEKMILRYKDEIKEFNIKQEVEKPYED